MKKIYIFAAVLALLTLSLNAQYQAEKKKAIQTATTEKKVGTPNYGIQKTVTLITGNRAPSRAPMRGDRATQTWSWSYGNGLPADWSFGDPTNTGWGDNGDGTYYIGVNDENVQPSEFSIQIPASVFTGYTNNVQVVIRAKADQGYNSQYISVNGDSKSITTSLANYTWTNVDVSNGMVINPKDSYTGLASITITGESASSGNTESETICEGTTTNEFLPIYGFYNDDFQINQMIYPENLLTNLVGKTLTSMTFYANGALGANLGTSVWTVKLGTTNQTSFASSLSSITRLVPDNVTIVAQGYSITTGINTMTINFTTPFTYTGGNLLVDFQSTTDGGWVRAYFYGVNQNSVTGYNSYNSSSTAGSNGHYSSGGVRQFLPQVTFTYEGEVEPKHDLAIALSAPATAGAGSTVNVNVTVTNNGDFAENGYTVTVTDGTNNVNITATEELPVGQTAEFTVQFTTSTNAGGQTVNYTATVACTDDADSNNNTATASTSLLACPPPENVAATASGQSGTMTWDAPIIPSTTATYTWDFESSSQFDDWTLVNNDNDSYNWQYRTYVEGTSADVFEPHSGTGYIVSPSFVNNVGALNPDNWLISPELPLGGTFTFWAKGTADGYYSENFGVFVYEGSYSGGITGFVQVNADVTTTFGWQQYTFDLSQYSGVGRIAIRHYDCTDQYWLEVDDIEYNVTAPGPQPTSYNIYLEGQLVNTVDANTFSYTFNNLNDGTYNCSVSAVYSYGESAAVPATFTINNINPTIDITPATQTINDAAAGSLTVTGTDIDGNINVSAGNDWSLNPTSLGNTGGDVNVTYTGRALSASTTVTATAANDNTVTATATVDYVADLYVVGDYGSGWNFSDNSNHMTYNNGTYTATITVNANAYILFARLLGNDNPWNTRDVFGPVSEGNWDMQGDNFGGDLNLWGSSCIHFPEGGTYRITIDANNGTFTITKVSGEQTAPPVITYQVDDEYVTITATGDGTVTLNVPGYDPVIGENGVATITVPRGYADNTIEVTATAQEVGKDESVPASQQITIPAGSGWIPMDGEYNNPNDLLSFLKDDEDIMLIDQFRVSTLNNDHPDHYTYTLRQTVNGEEQRSTPVTIPVYKTSSTMQGLYTQNQVTGDTDMKLKPNVVNTEMDFDVNPDRNVLYYNLYRGKKNDYYPTIADSCRVSQLQKYEEMDENENVHFFFKETYPSGIAPHYDHVANEIVERLDTNWVEAAYDDKLAYVPVIWTFGLYTARGDGKNNSYGSDIKREYMGEVEAEITGEYTDVNGSNGAYSTFDVNGVDYIIYHPVIKVTGNLPQNNTNNEVDYNDGDVAHYEPFMCRAWCTYEGIRDFGRDADGNLVDRGALPTPYLLGTEVMTTPVDTIGSKWTGGSERDPWSFGVPADTDPSAVTFKIRFYYKKVVTDAQAQQNGGNGAKIGGEAEEYFMAETEGNADDMVVAINELMNGIVPVSVTYVNPQGMQSSRPFDGVNIVVTRYSDGTTRTSKVIR